MKQLLLALILFLPTNQFLKSQVPERIEPFITPFGEFNFQRPEIPDNVVNILDFGAKPGGEFKNTSAINDAIEKLRTCGVHYRIVLKI